MRLSFYIFLLSGSLLVSCGPGSNSKPDFASRYYAIDSSLAGSVSTSQFIEPYRDTLQQVMNEVIGRTREVLIKKKPGTPLSNFVADLMLEAGKKAFDDVDKEALPAISVINIKGLRANLPQGDITVRNIYELMPFENTLTLLQLNGEQIKELYRHMGESNGDGLGGGSFTFRNGEVVSARVNNRPVKAERNYHVITADYLASGGDHYTIFSEAAYKISTPYKIRDLIIEHIRGLTRENLSIEPSTHPRIILE